MALHKAYKAYGKQNYKGMPSYELVLKMYERINSLLEESQRLYLELEFEEGIKKLYKAQKIIVNLQQTVDKNILLGKKLNSIYGFIRLRLNTAITLQRRSIIIEIIPLMTEIEETWRYGIRTFKERGCEDE